MANKKLKYLLFLTKNYSYSILKPLYDEILKRQNGDVFWYSTMQEKFDIEKKKWLKNSEEVLKFNPDVIFAPGNIVPHNWPGLKVQLFHGLGEEKQGHYRLNGLFNMYCTPGPYITNKFNNIDKNGKYIISETGWPKIDNIYSLKKNFNSIFKNNNPTILYAPTFSKKLTSAFELLDEIIKIQKRDYNWIIKFHELMDESLVHKYKNLESDSFKLVEQEDIIPLMNESDVLLTDTSSVAYEYLFFDKPIITFKAKTRIDKGINILGASDLEGAIIRALSDPDEYKENRDFYISELHPYQDGKSSQRVIEAVNNVLENGYIPLKTVNFTYQLNKWKTRNLVSL